MKALKISKNLIKVLIVTASLLLMPAAAYAGSGTVGVKAPVSADAAEKSPAASPVSIELSYGFENNAKGGRYLPLNIKYTNSEDAEFRGDVSIFSRESDDRICEYKNEITLKGKESRKVTYYIPLGIRAISLHLKLTDRSGTEYIDRDIDLGIDAGNAQLFIGIVSDTPEKLSYFDQASLHYGLLRSRTFKLDTADFPRQTRGLDMLDMIIISNYKIRNLDEAQSHALMEWVRGGGVLVLGTGARVDDTLGRYAPELLEDMYEAPELCEIDLSGGPETMDTADKYIELYCASVDIRGGDVVAGDVGLALLTAADREKGRIVVAAYDFADAAEYASEHRSFPADVLTACLGEDRMTALSGEAYGNDNTRYENISTLVSTGDKGRIPPVGIYALSIAAFILLAGPVLYVFLRQRGIGEYYRVGAVLLSAFFTLIIYLVGGRTRFDNAFYNFATITEADEASVTETAFLSLCNPYNREYSVSLAPEYTVYPVRRMEAVGRISEDWSDPIDVSTRIARESGKTEITVGEVGAFSPQYFSMERSSENEKGEGFNGEISLYGNELEGEITNDFDFDMTDVSMIFYGKVVSLGNIASGQTVSLDGLKVINVPLSSSREVAGLLTEDKEKGSTIAFYRDMYMTGYSTDVHIMGFREEDRESAAALVSNADLNGRGLSLAAGTAAVSNYKEDRIYRTTLVKGPMVISGDYDYRYNTMTTGEPCVLEYRLGSDMRILNLVMEWADKNTFSRLFTGTVSAYNYSTGTYDKLDTEKTVYDIDSITQYLSPANTITIRYTYQGNIPAGEKAALPMICVEGTENTEG